MLKFVGKEKSSFIGLLLKKKKLSIKTCMEENLPFKYLLWEENNLSKFVVKESYLSKVFFRRKDIHQNFRRWKVNMLTNFYKKSQSIFQLSISKFSIM